MSNLAFANSPNYQIFASKIPIRFYSDVLRNGWIRTIEHIVFFMMAPAGIAKQAFPL
jgi:hypothetical protein